MQIDQRIMEHGQHCIPCEDFMELCKSVKQKYPFSGDVFWMWKIFQFGFVYGKREERAKKKGLEIQ